MKKTLTNSELKAQYTNLYNEVKNPSTKPTSVTDTLTKDDPIEVWVTSFLEDGEKVGPGKSKEEIVKMAVSAYYGSQSGEKPGFDGMIKSD